jgi:transcriptional regulator with XRE-family HTH domain
MLYIRQIEKLKKQKKIASNSEIGTILNIKRQTVDAKMSGKTDFYVSELIKLSEYYHIPISYFFEEQDQKRMVDVDVVIDTLKELIKERIV